MGAVTTWLSYGHESEIAMQKKYKNLLQCPYYDHTQ